MASFLVWDTSGSPVGMQAACISCCSAALQAALPSSHCISPEMGTQATHAWYCQGEARGPRGHLGVQSGDA